MVSSFISLAIAIGCYSISQLQQHGKLKWGNTNFWDTDSWINKYKTELGETHGHQEYILVKAPNNWYYRFFKIKYKERFPLSATALVFLTDGYHFCQWLYNIFLSLSFALLIGIEYFIFIWLGVILIHSLTYRLLSK